jgi:tetratricopeptide (TPR) repeat protein
MLTIGNTMFKRAIFCSRAIFALGVFAMLALSVSEVPAQNRNRIEGRVVTNNGKALTNVRVFLLNDAYGQRGFTYTDGSGRYEFRNLSSGNYYIQVEPAGTGYERQSVRVEVNPYNPSGVGGGAETFRVDIVLKPEKPTKKTEASEEIVTGPESVVFVQEVPAAAKAAYEEGASKLKKEDLKGAEVSLTHAIELFPDYYDALEMLGSMYVKHDYFDAAAPLLNRAVEINRTAWHSFYGLGVSLLELNQRAEGLQALRRAVGLNPKSINASMRLGMELAKEDRFADEAIKVLTSTTQMAGKRLPDAYLVLASLCSKKGHYKEAADALNSYLTALPTTDQREDIKRKIEDLRQKAAHSQQ